MRATSYGQLVSPQKARREAHLDAPENRGVEDVDSGVDSVADKVLGLLDEAVDGGGSWDLKHNTVLRRILDLGHLRDGIG